MSDIEIPRPILLIRILMTDNNNIEAKTARYTFEEMVEMLGSNKSVKFWAVDENNSDVYVAVLRPAAMLGFIILDWMSYEKTMRAMQLAKARQGPPSPIISR